ncbi:hypothetical protein [Acinetobacter baumannii]|uniref:hypothetical protein n=1 Tax=Acinetobacter baumannii TaxID=470 RepID=UPI003B4372B1
MAITAYSKSFKRELDVEQLKRLFNDHLKDKNFAEFVKIDIECPCCGVVGARVVNESISPISNIAVKQAHFAFKNNNGVDAHLLFCDYYSGQDSLIHVEKDSVINLSRSGNEVTEAIRKLVCSAIYNNYFNQSDIRNMRKWFYEMRSNQDILVEYSKHQLNVLRKSITRSKRNDEKYIVDKELLKNDWFDLDEEVYESLATNFMYPYDIRDINGLNYILSKKSIIRKAISLSKKNHGMYEFDRSRLDEKYKLATRLSLHIIDHSEFFYQKLGRSVAKARANNPLMAYSATLLFVNDWDFKKSCRMHLDITLSTYVDENLGNTIGLNPFIHYDAWIALSYSSKWSKRHIGFDFETEFEKEKERLKILYGI